MDWLSFRGVGWRQSTPSGWETSSTRGAGDVAAFLIGSGQGRNLLCGCEPAVDTPSTFPRNILCWWRVRKGALIFSRRESCARAYSPALTAASYKADQYGCLLSSISPHRNRRNESRRRRN